MLANILPVSATPDRAVDDLEGSMMAEPNVGNGEAERGAAESLGSTEFATELLAMLTGEPETALPDTDSPNPIAAVGRTEPNSEEVGTSGPALPIDLDAPLDPRSEILVLPSEANALAAENSGFGLVRGDSDLSVETPRIPIESDQPVISDQSATRDQLATVDQPATFSHNDPSFDNSRHQNVEPAESEVKQEPLIESSVETSERGAPGSRLNARNESGAAATSLDQTIESVADPLHGNVASDQVTNEARLESSAADNISAKPVSATESGQSSAPTGTASTVATSTTSQPAALISTPLASQVAEHLVAARQSIQNGKTELEITLDPPELGKITIELTESNDQLSAKLFVSDSTTLASIRETVASMLDSLSEAGISFDDLQLESSSPDDSSNETEGNESVGQGQSSSESVSGAVPPQNISSVHSVNILA